MSQQSASAILKKNWHIITITVLIALLAAATAWAVSESNHANRLGLGGGPANSRLATDPETALDDHGIVPLTRDQASNNQTTADELTYLIEEEKLAHDVYQAMYDKWGVRVFGNIKESETMHQNMVLAVMKSRGLADPRKSEAGKFTNQDLQALYDRLIEQGNKSQAEAYKAGIIVEETDIADLKKTISNLDSKDTDVKDVLENLLRGSENHLRAFNRQASR